MDACTNKVFLLVSGFIDLGVKSVGYGISKQNEGEYSYTVSVRGSKGSEVLKLSVLMGLSRE